MRRGSYGLIYINSRIFSIAHNMHSNNTFTYDLVLVEKWNRLQIQIKTDRSVNAKGFESNNLKDNLTLPPIFPSNNKKIKTCIRPLTYAHIFSIILDSTNYTIYADTDSNLTIYLNRA